MRVLQILLAGADERAGKSSLLRRYIEDKFPTVYAQTIGVDFATKTKGNYKLQIWDIGGGVRFRSITNIYFRSSSAVIVNFDQSNRQSFEDMKKYLESTVKVNAPPNTVIVLSGNKSDLEPAVSVDEIEAFRATWNEENSNYQIVKYFPTSALKGDNVSEMFEEVTQMALNRVAVSSSSSDPVQTAESLRNRFITAYRAKLRSDQGRWCGLYGFFANSQIGDLERITLAEIIAHAGRANNRSREVCINLGWMNDHGRLHTNADDELLSASNSSDKAPLTNNIG